MDQETTGPGGEGGTTSSTRRLTASWRGLKRAHRLSCSTTGCSSWRKNIQISPPQWPGSGQRQKSCTRSGSSCLTSCGSRMMRVLDKLLQNRHAGAYWRFVEEAGAPADVQTGLPVPREFYNSFSSLIEFNARVQEVELECEVKPLKQEKYKLWYQNDDLNGKIFSLSLFETLCHPNQSTISRCSSFSWWAHGSPKKAEVD